MRIYRIAQNEAHKKPYKIIRICWGKEEEVGDSVYAHSSEQARMFAIQKNIGDIKAFQEMGCTIVARFDREKWEQEERARKVTEDLREEQTQTAWWQN